MDKKKIMDEIKSGNIDSIDFDELSMEELREISGGVLDDPSTYISSDPKDIYTFREQPIKVGDYVAKKGSHLFMGKVWDIASPMAFICPSLPYSKSNTILYPLFRLERYAGNKTLQ